MEAGEKETRRDIDDPLGGQVGCPRRPFRSTFGISRRRASPYVHAPACRRGRWDWGGGLKSLAEKGISCGEKDAGRGERKRAGPLAPHRVHFSCFAGAVSLESRWRPVTN